MRLRVQTVPPLRDTKVWFAPESFDKVPRTIIELKELMCWGLQALKDVEASEEDIVLLLDDFELMDDSSVGALVRDGDLLTVAMKCEPEVSTVESDDEMEGLPTEEEEEEDQEAEEVQGEEDEEESSDEEEEGGDEQHVVFMEQGKKQQVQVERRESQVSSGSDTDLGPSTPKKRKRDTVELDERNTKQRK